MKLNENGFAVTGIIYSMLVLFLALVLLIMSNLASRKVLFDKEKGQILEKINSSFLCTAISPTKQQVWNNTSSVMEEKVVGVQLSGRPYILGTVYSCDLGDGPRTFYVLKEDGDNVKLIMNENLDGTTTWCDQNGDNPSNIICAGDGAKSHLISQTSGWTKLASVGGTVELPEAQDLASGTPDWVRVNLSKNSGYWTSTPSSDRAQYVFSGFITSYKIDEYDGGVRPVITIPKSYISL